MKKKGRKKILVVLLDFSHLQGDKDERLLALPLCEGTVRPCPKTAPFQTCKTNTQALIEEK